MTVQPPFDYEIRASQFANCQLEEEEEEEEMFPWTKMIRLLSLN